MIQRSAKNDYSSLHSKTDIFRDVIYHIINQCEPMRPKGASSGHSVRQPRSASKRSALVIIKKMTMSLEKDEKCCPR